jgi:hypothetical protein
MCKRNRKQTRAMPAWYNMPIKFSKEKHILVGFIPMVSPLFCLKDFSTKRYDLELWPLTLKTSHPGDQVYQVVWSWSLQFYTAYKVSIIKWCYTNDLWPWQTISCFFASWWPSVPSCIILKLTIWSISCLQCFLLSDAMTLTFDPWP